jgi:peptide/nickel transport system substrate-binding protein
MADWHTEMSKVARRRFLKMAIGGAGVSGALALVACGQAPPSPAAPQATTAPAAPKPTTAPAAQPTAAAAQPTAQAAAPVAKKAGGSLKAQQIADVVNVNPHLSRSYVDRVVMDTVFGGLSAYDEQMNPIPDLAESWEVPDERTYIFRLRKGVTFHNGRAVTPEDVKWSIEKIYEVGNKGQWANYIPGITKIEIPDASTVKLILDKPNAILAGNLPVASIVPPEAYDSIDTNPIGFGPFRFVERVPGQYFKVARYEKYWDQSVAYPDEITFTFATEEATQVANLQTGAVDMHGTLPISRVPELKNDAKFKLYDTGEGTLGWDGLLLNADKPPTDNVKLRQAIAHAINKDVINQAVYYGLGAPDNGFLPKGHWAHVPDGDLGGYRYDPEKAKQLLVEAGHPSGIDLTWTIGTIVPEFTRFAELAQQDLAKVGIRVTLKSIEWATYVQEVTGQRNFELASDGFGGRVDPDLQLGVFAGPESSGNKMRYTHPRVTELFELGRGTTNQAKRKEYYTEIQKRLVEDVPVIRMNSRPTIWGALPKVSGVQMTPEGRIRWHKLTVAG